MVLGQDPMDKGEEPVVESDETAEDQGREKKGKLAVLWRTVGSQPWQLHQIPERALNDIHSLHGFWGLSSETCRELELQV